MDQWKDRGEYAFSRNGRAYTESERRDLFLRKGQCPKCGIQTHKVSLRIKRVPCNNDEVWQGVCIKCRPNAVPKDVLVAWTARCAASGTNTTSGPHVQVGTTGDPLNRAGLAASKEGNASHAPSTTSTTGSSMRHLGMRPRSTATAISSRAMTSPEPARTIDPTGPQRLARGQAESSCIDRFPQQSQMPFAAFNGLDHDAALWERSAFTEWMSAVIECIGESEQVVLALLRIPPTDAEDMQEACCIGSLERFLVKLRPAVVESSTNRSLWVSLSTAVQTMLLAGSKEAARQVSDQGYHVLLLDRLRDCDDVVEAQELMLSIVIFVTYEPASFIQANGIQTVVKVLSSFHAQPIVVELASRCIYSLLSEEQQRLIEKALALLNREVAAFFEGLFTRASASSCTSDSTWELRALLAIYAVGDSERKTLVLDELKDLEARLMFLSCLSLSDHVIVPTAWIIVDALVDQHSPETLLKKASELIVSLDIKSTICSAFGPFANVLVSCLASGDEDIRQNVKTSTSALVSALTSFDRNSHVLLAASLMWSVWNLTEAREADLTIIPSLVQSMADISSLDCIGQDGELNDHAFLLLSFYGILSNVFVSQPVELCNTPLLLPICPTADAAVAGASLMQVEAFGLSMLYSHYPESFLEQHATSIVERYTNVFVASDAKEQLLGMEAFAYVAKRNQALRSPAQLLVVFDTVATVINATTDSRLIEKGIDLVLFLLSKCDEVDGVGKLLDGIGAIIHLPNADAFTAKSARIVQFCFESSSTLPVTPRIERYFSSTMTSWLSQEGDVRDSLWLALWALLATNLESDGSVLTRLFMLVVRLLRDCLQQKLTTDSENSFNPLLVGYATGALSCASRRLTQPISFNDADTVVSMIYYVMGNEREETESLERVLESVIYLLEFSKGPLIECGVIVAIIDAMDEFEASETVQLRGSTALASLASSKTLQVILSILQTDGIDVLVDALSSFPSNKEIQREVCRAFSYLSVDQESRMLLLSQGGLFLLTQAMRSFPDCCLVQEYTSTALLALASDSPTSLNDPNVIDVAVVALPRHLDCPVLQENMASLINSSASACSVCEARLLELRGENAILKSARRYLYDAAIVERCFAALVLLLRKITSFCDDDMIRLIIDGMLAHIEDDLVLQSACNCLSILAAANQKDAALVRVLGGERVLILVLRSRFLSRETSIAALRAHMNLGGIDHTEEDIDVILSVMWRFREDPDVLSAGCQILSNAVPKSAIRSSYRCRLEVVLGRAKSVFNDSSESSRLAGVAIEKARRQYCRG